MKYSGYFICIDMDHTLKNTDGSISVENQQAIRMFQENGGRFTVATGRNAAHIAEYAAAFVPNAPICALNGAHIYDAATERELYRGTIPLTPDVLKCVADIMRPFEAELRFFRVINDTNLTEFYSIAELLKNEAVICNGQWCKVLTVWETEATTLCVKSALMQSKLAANFRFVRSWHIGLEFNARADCKGTAVVRLKEKLPDVKKLVCIGDYENDLSMIQSADIGVAVANAILPVRAVADMVTVSNNEAALAAVIHSLPPLE